MHQLIALPACADDCKTKRRLAEQPVSVNAEGGPTTIARSQSGGGQTRQPRFVPGGNVEIMVDSIPRYGVAAYRVQGRKIAGGSSPTLAVPFADDCNNSEVLGSYPAAEGRSLLPRASRAVPTDRGIIE
jgi:hypothetical protein